jgi:hypothetical protein
MAGRTNRYRRGEKSTSVRVGYLGGKLQEILILVI